MGGGSGQGDKGTRGRSRPTFKLNDGGTWSDALYAETVRSLGDGNRDWPHPVGAYTAWRARRAVEAPAWPLTIEIGLQAPYTRTTKHLSGVAGGCGPRHWIGAWKSSRPQQNSPHCDASIMDITTSRCFSIPFRPI